MKKEKSTAVTREDLREFYKQVALGKWEGREKEAEAEEIRLLKALGVRLT